MGQESINWDKLGFDYIKTDKRYLSYFRNGEWDNGVLTEDNVLHISEGSTALHYGQQCFEGMKAYRCKDGSINLFRPDQNAARMQRSCARLLMPAPSTEAFIEACKQVVKANERFIPPYGTGGALYLRPFVIGVGDNIGVRTAPEFTGRPVLQGRHEAAQLRDLQLRPCSPSGYRCGQGRRQLRGQPAARFRSQEEGLRRQHLPGPADSFEDRGSGLGQLLRHHRQQRVRHAEVAIGTAGH